MSTIKIILNKSSVFASLGEDDIQRLETLFEKREIFPGDIIASAKDAAQYFFILDSGSILLAMEKGKSIVLKTPGDFIGLELLSAKGIYKTTLTVLDNGSVLAIPRQDFLTLIHEDSSAAASIMGSWQEYLNETAPFVTNIEDLNLPDRF